MILVDNALSVCPMYVELICNITKKDTWRRLVDPIGPQPELEEGKKMYVQKFINFIKKNY